MLNEVRFSASDVERVASRQYAPEEYSIVNTILARYGTKSHHVEKERVRLCALKLAAGDVRELERQIGVASVDFRDVVAGAEYPEQGKLGFVGIDRIDPAERVRILEADRLQFQRWLHQENG